MCKTYLRIMLSDEMYMSRCIQLAKLGEGYVSPNPMVGAVIVYDDAIIGEGYHQKFGSPHAEVNAIESVKNKELLKNSTIYVSLEPCSHFGKTPPCCNLIAIHQIKRVVIGCRDPYSEVNGNGITFLNEAGLDVEVGILEKECKELNGPFFTFIEKKRPYILLKWAKTINGFLDNNGHTIKISSPESETLVHQWRSIYQAILVGRRTVEKDNPSLTVRRVCGKNPIRIVLDSQCSLDKNLNVFNKDSDTFILNTIKDLQVDNVRYVKLNTMSPQNITEAIYHLGIQSVLIEGGAETLRSFIDLNLWDEAKVITGRLAVEIGTKAPEFYFKSTETEDFFSDVINTYRNI